MIVPSIDIRKGRAVQLVGGREQVLDGGDPFEVAERLAVAGELAVIDLDAALGEGSNVELVRELVRRHPCRVGGGIRSEAAALDWMDAGAEAVILGTAARPELLERLPRERVIAALDAVEGEVVVEGWRTRTGESVEARLDELRSLVGGFLLTFVEREGRLGGTDLERARALVERASPARVTIAGGVTTPQEITALDRVGADAQVGMALYTGRLDLAEALAAPLRSDRADGLWPTVVCDAAGRALGLVYSSLESLREAIATGAGVYQSRRRGLWRKGETSGDRQRLLRVDVDCDRDALRFTVAQEGGGFCHEGSWSCWPGSGGLASLERRLASRLEGEDEGSLTRRLVADPGLLARKLREEAAELAEARGAEEASWEAADLLYFALTALAREGASLDVVERELDRRSLRIRRRPAGGREVSP
jgi:phosphoribosyl-ATP pyrophosphohydrolase